MPIAYFRQRADQEFWANQWLKVDVGRLVKEAEGSYLTKLIVENLPAKGRILEAGCGLGQYVMLLRDQGFDIEGIDYVDQGIRACLAFDPTCPVRVSDAADIDVPDKYYESYISLGVVEHVKDGPLEILREAHRVLSDDGVLLLSTPFQNLLRRTFHWYIKWQNRSASSRREFYQYAFSKKEISGFLKEAGFRAVKFLPYDPGRIPKKALKSLLRKKIVSKRGDNGDKAAAHKENRPEVKKQSLSRRLLYSQTSLLTLSHMILVVATKDA